MPLQLSSSDICEGWALGVPIPDSTRYGIVNVSRNQQPSRLASGSTGLGQEVQMWFMMLMVFIHPAEAQETSVCDASTSAGLTSCQDQLDARIVAVVQNMRSRRLTKAVADIAELGVQIEELQAANTAAKERIAELEEQGAASASVLAELQAANTAAKERIAELEKTLSSRQGPTVRGGVQFTATPEFWTLSGGVAEGYPDTVHLLPAVSVGAGGYAGFGAAEPGDAYIEGEVVFARGSVATQTISAGACLGVALSERTFLCGYVGGVVSDYALQDQAYLARTVAVEAGPRLEYTFARGSLLDVSLVGGLTLGVGKSLQVLTGDVLWPVLNPGGTIQIRVGR